MWDLISVESGKPELVNDYLKKGYEPFAISTNSYGFPVVWMKREVKSEICNQQSGSVKGASRKTAKESKG